MGRAGSQRARAREREGGAARRGREHGRGTYGSHGDDRRRDHLHVRVSERERSLHPALSVRVRARWIHPARVQRRASHRTYAAHRDRRVRRAAHDDGAVGNVPAARGAVEPVRARALSALRDRGLGAAKEGHSRRRRAVRAVGRAADSHRDQWRRSSGCSGRRRRCAKSSRSPLPSESRWRCTACDYCVGGNCPPRRSAAERSTGRNVSTISRRDTRDACAPTFIAATTSPTTLRTGTAMERRPISSS